MRAELRPRPDPASPPRPDARAIGVVYLLYFVTAVLAVLLVKGLVVSGDPGTTAENLLANKALYQSGFAVGLVANALYITLTALFYGLFAPVDRGLSLLAAFFGLAGCAVQIIGSLFQLAPLLILGDGSYQAGFSAGQLQLMASLFLGLRLQTFHMALVLFGVYIVLIGCLVHRSEFLPRMLGVLLMLAGLGWLTYLWPPLASALSPFIQPFGFLAEFLLMLWLLVLGVRVSRRQETAYEA